MEAVIFFLVIVWMLRIAGSRGQGAGSKGQRLGTGHQRSEVGDQRSVVSSPWSVVRGLLPPLLLFFVFVLFQLLPLPPGLIHILSPATFEVYTHSLLIPTPPPRAGEDTGGGRRQQGATNGESSSPSRLAPHASREVPVILPTPAEVNSGAPVPFEREPSALSGQPSAGSSNPQFAIRNPQYESGQWSVVGGERSFRGTWLPLSLAPSQTRSDLLKLASYAALFFLVLLYPFTPPYSSPASGGGHRWGNSADPGVVRGQKTHGKISEKLISLFMKRKGKMGGKSQRSEISGHHERREGLGARGQRSDVHGQSSAGSSNPKSAIRNPQSESGLWSVVSSRLLILIALSGLIVAAIGFIQRFTWNGKILWFFIPYDWSVIGGPTGDFRASGPFVDPDHFANYLAMTLPLALGFVIYSRYLFRKDSQIGAKIFFGMILFVAFVSVLLSLSRGGWMTAAVGIGLLLWFGPANYAKRPSEIAKSSLVARGSLAIIVVLLVVSLFFVGSGAREQVDTRLHETLTQDMGFAGRAAVWRNTLKMIRDFPVFGVGLGSWQDLFQHYQKPPWAPAFYREAHNDYVQLLAETGVIGFVLLFLFFFKAGKQLFSSLRSPSDDNSSKVLMAMILAALATMTLHEFFDFNLQIPANALLFTVLLAVGVRLTAGSREQGAGEQRSDVSGVKTEVRGQTSDVGGVKAVVRSPWSVVRGLFPSVSRLALSPLRLALCAVSAILIVAAFRQEMIPYPYNLTMPATVAEANAMVLGHPALSTPHVYLLRLMEEKAPVEWQLNQARAALWLNPTDPFIHDQYARLLLGAGEQQEGLNEVAQSVLNAPSFVAHYYLNGRLLPWLSPAEKNAVETGFKKADVLNYPGATESLADFYTATERFADEGRLFEGAAARKREATQRAGLFIKAGSAYLKAGDSGRAETLLRNAAMLAPTDPRPYQMLATMVYGPQKDVANVSRTISEGIKNGAPAFDLYLASAEAAQKAGALDESKKALSLAKDALRTEPQEGQEPLRSYYRLAETAQRLGLRDEAISALLQALEFRSSSTETLLRLADLYFQNNNFDRAAYYFRSYLEINPGSADAFYHLALAEERQYRFPAAEAAYKQAMQLAPQQQLYRQAYEALKVRLAQNKEPAH